jgi:2'-5' RNA ligase
MQRLFFALQPTAEQSAEVGAVADSPVARFAKQAVPRANYHVTLSFIGAVAPENLERLLIAADTVHAARMSLEFDSLDYWQKPGILCLTAPVDEMSAALARRLSEAAVSAGCAPDAKPFRAHVTVGRKVDSERVRTETWPVALAARIAMRFDAFVLMESRREGGASQYLALKSWPLGQIHTGVVAAKSCI